VNDHKIHSLTRLQIGARAVVSLIIVAAVLLAMAQLEPDGFIDPWIKALHIIAVIGWMAGMLYLPRLFVYHCQAQTGSDQAQTFKIMERRLLRIIINPAMIIVWITGLWMAWKLFGFRGGWLHLKIMVVVLLSAFHGFLAGSTRRFAEDRNKLSQKSWRILNEVPTLLMIIAVVAVVVKIP